MDILSIIRENLPDGVEVGDKNLNIIAKEVKQAIGEEFIPKTAYSKQSEKVLNLESKLSEMSVVSTDIEAYKNRIKELESSFESFIKGSKKMCSLSR